ncbi:MAG: putative fatty acid desaturase [Hydrocarboniphaga sp.]|uniref:fatty acid desaturase n=1 Tax=Hydrocarboniphaga sp. TaxID=2033016 RepID=UPI0026027B94|nr:fatty acid desaturase [Hydrocarboniphaga sp.]MDB5971342.1 putative fatty acid desaturase [Hydrocarboniphaga sp.]
MTAPTAMLPTTVPHRKLIRSWLIPLCRRNTALAIALAAVDCVLLALLMTGVVSAPTLPGQLLCGAAAGFVIGRMFILAHDACHHSLTAHRGLNRALGRLLMLPSLTPYSLWDKGHNVVHHGYTNLRDFDFVWQPKSLAEFQALSPTGRSLERIYRSGWAPWMYYLVEIWWRRLFFPSRSLLPTRRRIFWIDSMTAALVAGAWIAALIAVAVSTGQSPLRLLLAGFVLPQLVWNAMIGFVVYIHHTHPAIAWYSDKQAWGQSQPFVSTTVHVRFRKFLGLDWGSLIHHINEHTAHHVDMTIPLYRLRAAQSLLEQRIPGIVVQTFSWRWYFDTARRCKLYDYERRRWLDFEGRPS